jgi:hypothetical protein
VRLPFLDVLQAEHAAGGAATGQLPPLVGSGQTLLGPAVIAPPTVAYAAAVDPPGGVSGWLRRHAGLLGLLAVLLMAGLIGLLVGHWVSGSSGPQVVKVDFPSGLPAAAAPSAAASSPSTAAPASAASAHKASKAQPAASGQETEASEEKEAQEIESKPAPLPAPKPTQQSSLKHLESTTGKKRAEEINKLGTAPIETRH